jgi:hypothetical protein
MVRRRAARRVAERHVAGPSWRCPQGRPEDSGTEYRQTAPRGNTAQSARFAFHACGGQLPDQPIAGISDQREEALAGRRVELYDESTFTAKLLYNRKA